MEVVVNGNTMYLPENACLLDLIKQYGLDEQTTGIAVAVNQCIIPKSQWTEVCLKPNDKVEIVWARQGG